MGMGVSANWIRNRRFRNKIRSNSDSVDLGQGNKIVPTEREIQKAILRYLELRKIYCWRNNTGGFTDKRDHYYTFGKKGSGDILGLTPKGRFISIEVKRPGNKPTPAQVSFMNVIRDNGGIAFVATSIDDIENKMEELKDEKNNNCTRVHVACNNGTQSE